MGTCEVEETSEVVGDGVEETLEVVGDGVEERWGRSGCGGAEVDVVGGNREYKVEVRN